MFENSLDDRATTLLQRFASTSIQTRSLRFNAGDYLTSLDALDIYKTVTVVSSDGGSGGFVIVGINYEIDGNRIMCELQLRKYIPGLP